MFLRLDKDANYTDNLFGKFISHSLEAGQDCLIIFRNHIFLVLSGDINGTYSCGVFRTHDKLSTYTYRGEFIITDKDIHCYKYIGYRFMCEMRDIYKDTKTIDFPFDEVLIGLVDDYGEHLVGLDYETDEEIDTREKNEIKNANRRAKKSFTNKSKVVAEILRHDPYKHGLTISNEGWVSVFDIIEKVKCLSSFKIIAEIVGKDSKGRYSFNTDFTMVRANQGHSLDCVTIKLERVFPTHALYHGTNPNLFDTLMEEGLKPMKRQYVHLSSDIDTAYSVGKRYSKNKEPIIFKIENFDNMEVFISENGVHLTKSVDPKLLTKIEY